MAFYLKTETAIPKTHGRRFSCRPENAYRGLRVENLGRRFYSANLARWINRDPIGEEGGDNLYGFLSNCSICRVDAFGLCLFRVIPAEVTGKAFGMKLSGPGYEVDFAANKDEKCCKEGCLVLVQAIRMTSPFLVVNTLWSIDASVEMQAANKKTKGGVPLPDQRNESEAVPGTGGPNSYQDSPGLNAWYPVTAEIEVCAFCRPASGADKLIGCMAFQWKPGEKKLIAPEGSIKYKQGFATKPGPMGKGFQKSMEDWKSEGGQDSK